MTSTGLKVFLSSTFGDLFSERKAVEAVIHRMALTYVGMEHFGSFSKEPLEKCLEKVRASDVVILVAGNRYGSKISSEAISFTEAEYREACRHSKPVLSYCADYKTDPNIKNEEGDLIRFREELLRTRGVSQFSSEEDLAWKVASDLYRELPPFKSDNVPTLTGRIEELMKLFQDRAQMIEREFARHYKYAPVQEYLDEFKELHLDHLSYIKNGNLVLAHEILNRIHYLSFRLERDEFWRQHDVETPHLRYRLRGDAFQHGPITSVYAKECPWSLWAADNSRSAAAVYSDVGNRRVKGTHPQG